MSAIAQQSLTVWARTQVLFDALDFPLIDLNIRISSQ